MKENKKLSFHYLLWYFVIFSIVGLLLETIFCYGTTGVLESRKGLLYGPFCPIYGVGAACLIALLDRYQDHPVKIFFYGAIAGSVIEYVLSYGLEAIYGSRFWDYAYKPFNLNGRICLTFSVYWGILSLFLMKGIKPKIDFYLKKIPEKKIKWIDFCILAFFVFDVILTIWSIQVYLEKIKGTYTTENKNQVEIYIEEHWFTNDYMAKTFPNLRIRNNENQLIFARDYLQNIDIDKDIEI